jgi:hypothetical protein
LVRLPFGTRKRENNTPNASIEQENVKDVKKINPGLKTKIDLQLPRQSEKLKDVLNALMHHVRRVVVHRLTLRASFTI